MKHYVIGYTKNQSRVTLEVRLETKDDKQRLSICGAVWNKKNDDHEIGGQCIDELASHIKIFATGWDREKLAKVVEVWQRWHLNDMRAECEHQRSRGEKWTTHPAAICPDCGYTLGSAWLYEELPADVVAFIESL